MNNPTDTLHAVTHALSALDSKTERGKPSFSDGFPTGIAGCEVCDFDDGYNHYEIFYRVSGRYYPATEIDPAEQPEVTIVRITSQGIALPAAAMSESFMLAIQELAEEDMELRRFDPPGGDEEFDRDR